MRNTKKSPTRRRSTNTNAINNNKDIELLEKLFARLEEVENLLGKKLKELAKHHNGQPFPILVNKSSIVIDLVKAINIPSPDIIHVPEAYCSLTVDKYLVDASSISNPSSNPVWHDHFEIDVVKSKPSRKELGKKLDLATIHKSFFYFQISSKNDAGADDYLGYVGLSGKDVLQLCEEVTSGLTWFDIVPVVPQSSSRSKKKQPKLALRFHTTGHVPALYNQILVEIVKCREKIEILYKTIISNITKGIEDTITAAEVANSIKSIRGDVEKLNMNLTKHVPHFLYCGLYDQLLDLRRQHESIFTLAEEAKVTDKQIVMEREKVLKSFNSADITMMTTNNVAKIRYSLVQEVKKATNKYAGSTTKRIIQSLLQLQNELLAKLKKKSRRIFMQPVDILTKKVVADQTVTTEKAINTLNNIRNKDGENHQAVIQDAHKEIQLLQHFFWDEMVNAIFDDWNLIYNKDNKKLQSKHGSHAKQMRDKSRKEDKYRDTIKQCRKQLNSLLEMQEEFAQSEAVIPPLKESHRLLKMCHEIELAKEKMVRKCKKKKVQLGNLHNRSKKQPVRSQTSSSIFNIKIKKLTTENERIKADIETVDKKIENYNFILRSSPWKKKVQGSVDKTLSRNRSKSPTKKKSRREGLPVGWKAYKDKSTGQTYYHHRTSNKTQWTKPII